MQHPATPTIRKYPRAPFHDYNCGLYFITVCTKSREHHFGEITDATMRLTDIGRALQANLESISTHYPDVQIPLYVVMPNHFHAIIAITETAATDTATTKTAPTETAASDTATTETAATNTATTETTETAVGSPPVATAATDAAATDTAATSDATQPPATKRLNAGRLNQLSRLAVATGGDPTLVTHHNCRLGNVVSGIKAHVSRYARSHNIRFAWQPRYHDHIIRGIHDGNKIAEYIENNVARWESDCFYN
ncbi:MAG: hypothetical protein NC406_05975 [Bacteroides sp.]|nr:hypothetical protein [Bacteroides sp.]MCM1095411.1 hypothetical protein [Terasakiella sp.]